MGPHPESAMQSMIRLAAANACFTVSLLWN